MDYISEDEFNTTINSNFTFEKSRPRALKNENIFDVKKAQKFLNSVTAPWIQDLNLQIDSVSEWKCKFTLNYSEKLVRQGDIICGQAIVSAADTAMIVAVIVQLVNIKK